MADARGGRRTALGVTARLERLTIALAIIQVFCAGAIVLDVVLEFPDLRYWYMLPAEGLAHIVSEVLIVLLMVLGFVLAGLARRELAQQRDVLAQELHALRKDFDRILQARLDGWNLTAAQRDVALLCLRGLRISEIARLRGSADGTVKAHMSAIFRAAQVGTRAELVALFMEEFMDFGAASPEGTSDKGILKAC